MTTCKTCKHWLPLGEPAQFGECTHTNPDPKRTMLRERIDDEDGYLISGCDFGCVNHEEKQ